MSRYPQKNLSWSIKKIVVITTSILFLIAISIYIVYELVDTYKQKTMEIKNVSQMLAESASISDGANVVGHQVTYLLEQDPTLQSISFYSINQSLSFVEKTKPDWQVILGEDIMSFHQPVTGSIETKQAQTSFNAPNRTLIGYINVTLDLKKLKQQWFMQHAWLLLSFFGCYLVALIWMMGLLSKPFKSINQLSSYANDLIAQYQPKNNRILRDRNDYWQLNNIYKALTVMQHLCQQTETEMQASIKQTQKPEINELLAFQQSNFQSMITHELKTSLNAIFGGLQLLDNQYTSQEQEDAIGIIRKGSTDLELILGQIIQLNKIEKGQMKVEAEKIEPLKIISSLIQTYDKPSKDKGIDIVSRIHHIDQALKGDNHKIYSILDALVNNAIKFTRTGNVIIESYLQRQDKQMYWRIEVKDTGIGIEENHLQDIFLPFFQVDPSMSREFEGVGVGLGVAQKLSKLMQGELTVQSVYGQGSTFCLSLPLQDWVENEESQLLANISLSFFTVKKPSYFLTVMSKFGAKIHEFTERELLMEHIFRDKPKILALSSQLQVEEAKELVTQIRVMESYHRVFIVYYYDSLLDKQIKDLQATGVDVCQTTQLTHYTQALAIQKWWSY